MQKKETLHSISLIHVEKLLLAFFVVNGFLTSLFVWRMPPNIPVFLSRPLGSSQLTSPWWLISLPVISLLIYISSVYVRRNVKSEGVLIYMFMWIQSFVSLFLLLALIYIITLVY